MKLYETGIVARAIIRKIILASLVLFSSALPLHGVSAVPSYWGSLKVGPYPVAFSADELTDASRTFGSNQSRELRVGVCHPTQTESSYGTPSLQYYIDHFEGDRCGEQWLQRLSGSEPRHRAARLRSAAVVDGASLREAFPLVIYAPGYRSTPTIHIATMEYLASHGFVVATTASLGAVPGGMTFDSDGIDAQARDIEFLIAVMSRKVDVDVKKIAVVGLSFGAGAGLLTAMHRNDVSAVVSLDGVEGMPHGMGLVAAAPGFSPERLRASFLRIGRPPSMEADQTLFRQFRLSDRLWVQLAGASHLDFIPSQRFAAAAGDSAVGGDARIYELTMELVLAFLNSVMRDGGTVSATLNRLRAPFSVELAMRSLQLPADANPPPQSDLFASLMNYDRFSARLENLKTLQTQLIGMPLLTEGQFDSILFEALDRGANDEVSTVAEL